MAERSIMGGGVSGTLVGRKQELEALERFLEDTAEGFRGLFIEGEAGIGKTRLWQEAVTLAPVRGRRVLATRSGASEAQLAFAGLSDLLEEVLDEVLVELPPPQRRALEVALLLAEADRRPPDQRAVAAALLAALRRLAAREPLVVAVDDLQWLDAPSRRVLEFALRRLEDEPVAFLATVRLGAGDTEPADVVRAVGERLGRLLLGPLSVAALYDLIGDRLGLRLSRATLLRIHEAAGGNPFYALELARGLAAGGEPARDEPLPVPPSLQEVVRGRLAVLDPTSARTLLHVAALAQPTVAVLAAATGDRDGVEADLERALGAGLVELSGDRVRFAHPLLASAHYGSATPRERRLAHRRLAAVVTDPEERARHLALGSEGPDDEVAAALDGAAEHAIGRGALVAAADLADEAVALTPPARPELHTRRIVAARHAFAAGFPERAGALLDEALAASNAGRERAEVLWRLAELRRDTQDIRAAVDLYRRAADEAAEDVPLRAAILEQGAEVMAYWEGGYEMGLEWAAGALELAERAGDPRLLARALAKHGYMQFFGGRGQPHESMRRAEELELSLDSGRFERGPRYLYSLMLYQAGELDAARERLEALCDVGRRTGDVASAMALITLAWLEWESGRWDRAWELASEAQDLTALGGWDVVEARAAFTLAHIEATRGDVETGRAHALEALELTERTGRLSRGPLGCLGLLELSLERYAEAWGYLELAVERNRARSFLAPASLAFDAVEALAGLGRVEDARRLLEPLETASHAFAWRWAVAAALRCGGLIDAAADELEQAEASLVEAVVIGEGVGMPLELGRSLLALGTVQRRLRRKQAARQTLQRAAATFDGLGARVFAQRARRELARIGGRSTPATGLSATEAQIVELVQAGHSNREVAAALHLSPKTVEWNLSKIYRKLGVRSRTELAASRTAPA